MAPVERMDRTLKAWGQEYGDVNPEVLPVLEIPENSTSYWTNQKIGLNERIWKNFVALARCNSP